MPLIRLATLAAMSAAGALWIALDRDDRRRAAAEPVLPGGAPGSAAKLSVVVPARDEERNLAACLETLLSQTRPPDEIIVVDDGSRDETAAIALRFRERSPRVTLVTARPLPGGWTGKCNAVYEGSSRATGERILFLDADTRLAPDCVAAALAFSETERLDMLSITARQLTESAWERAVQPVVYALLNRQYPLGSGKDAANGQFLMVSAAAYAAVGTHEAVRSEIVEDVALARRFRAAGLHTRFVGGLPFLSTRMYAGLGELWEGWSKNAFPLFRARGADTALSLGVRTLPWIAMIAAALAGEPILAATAGAVVLVGLACDARIRARQGFDAWTALFQPLGASIVAAILVHSAARHALRRPVRWKGRSYSPEETATAKRAGGSLSGRS